MKVINSTKLLNNSEIEAIRKRYCLSSLENRSNDQSIGEKFRQRVASSQGFHRSPLKSYDDLMNQQNINQPLNSINNFQVNNIKQFKMNSLSVEAKRLTLIENEISSKILQKSMELRQFQEVKKGQQRDFECIQNINYCQSSNKKNRVMLVQDNLRLIQQRRLFGQLEQDRFKRNKVENTSKQQTLPASKITMPLPRFSRFTRVIPEEVNNSLSSHSSRRNRRVINLSSGKLNNTDQPVYQFEQQFVTSQEDEYIDRSAFLLSTLSTDSVSLQPKMNCQSKKNNQLSMTNQKLSENNSKAETFQQHLQQRKQQKYEKTNHNKHSVSVSDFSSQKDSTSNDSLLKYENLRELTSLSQDNLLEHTCDTFDNINVLSLSLGSVELSEEKQKYQPAEQLTNKKVLLNQKEKVVIEQKKQYIQQEEKNKQQILRDIYSELQKEQDSIFNVNQQGCQEQLSPRIVSNQLSNSSPLIDQLQVEKKQAEIDLLKLNCSLIAHMQNTRNLFSSMLPSQLSIQLEQLINKVFDNASETLKAIDQLAQRQ